MRPFAVLYAHSEGHLPAVYFLLFSEVKVELDGASSLPPPFRLGPFLFGKNRVSILTFGQKELKIERCSDHPVDWSFILAQGAEETELNAQRPFAVYNLLAHRFESISEARIYRGTQFASLTRRAAEVVVQVDPKLLWIPETACRFSLLLACSAPAGSSTVSDSSFFKLLDTLRPYTAEFLRQQDPQARPDKGTFDDLATRARVIFAVLARLVHEAGLDGGLALPDVPLSSVPSAEACDSPASVMAGPRLLWLPDEATLNIPSVAASETLSPAPDWLSRGSSSSMGTSIRHLNSILSPGSASTASEIMLTPVPNKTEWLMSPPSSLRHITADTFARVAVDATPPIKINRIVDRSPGLDSSTSTRGDLSAGSRQFEGG